MTIFSCNNLSKSFNDKILFDGVSFGMEEGEKLGIIGKNGIGKTTLMKIIAGTVEPDSGSVIFNKETRLEYLDQMPFFDRRESALEVVMQSQEEVYSLLEEHREICRLLEHNNDTQFSKRLDSVTHRIEHLNGWNLDSEAKKILSELGIEDFYKDVMNLSGGLKKRVSLARALISNPNLLILDEPTNHLDADSVQWLQDRLQNSSNSLMFVTHDRYFLDAVATRIIEIDQNKIFLHPGSYQDYLERKEAYLSSQRSTVEHLLSRLRSELAWLQKGAKARRRKQKSRIDWVEVLQREAKQVKEKKIKIELGKIFLGSRIIEAHDIMKDIGGKLLFRDFTYIAKPKDRIGIIGPNGSGKSTLLNVLAGYIQPDKGRVQIGASVNIGFYQQEITGMKDEQSVISVLREVAEYIDVGEGRDRYLTCRDLLDRFLFPRNQQSAFVGTLSGGERRRLALLKVLMANPNVLLLDEPTNDFDIQTLNAFENFLDDFYGVLIIVSHDRSFLDRTVDFILSFDGKGNIKEYPGNYTTYLEKREAELRLASLNKPAGELKPKREKFDITKRKLSYMEQREFELLSDQIDKMESRKAELETLLHSGGDGDYKLLESASTELVSLEAEIDKATERWMELSDMVE